MSVSASDWHSKRGEYGCRAMRSMRFFRGAVSKSKEWRPQPIRAGLISSRAKLIPRI